MLDELLIAMWFEGLYQQMLRAAAGRGLRAISRTAFWLLVVRHLEAQQSSPKRCDDSPEFRLRTILSSIHGSKPFLEGFTQ